MPYLDGTGPYGSGPVGRGRGPCRAGGRLVGRGMGRGPGRGGYFSAVDAPVYLYDEPYSVDVRRSMELEAEMLERRLNTLKEQLKQPGTDPK